MNNLIFRDSYVDRKRFTPTPITFVDWFRPPRTRDAWGLRVAWRLDYGKRLAEVRAATLVTAGRFDPQMPLACACELADVIRDARLVIFERSGHYPFVEEPEEFWTNVNRFLRTEEHLESGEKLERARRSRRRPVGALGTRGV
jgi:pimeloyl-ACP methyl ester carboxylesterase